MFMRDKKSTCTCLWGVNTNKNYGNSRSIDRQRSLDIMGQNVYRQLKRIYRCPIKPMLNTVIIVLYIPNCNLGSRVFVKHGVLVPVYLYSSNYRCLISPYVLYHAYREHPCCHSTRELSISITGIRDIPSLLIRIIYRSCYNLFRKSQ